MRLERHWWRLKKNMRNWCGVWMVRLGYRNPFGKCPQCRVGMRYGIDKRIVKNPDGTTTIVAMPIVGCPSCGYKKVEDLA
jgi:hypothetical protein